MALFDIKLYQKGHFGYVDGVMRRVPKPSLFMPRHPTHMRRPHAYACHPLIINPITSPSHIALHAYAWVCVPLAHQPTHITPSTVPGHPSFHAYTWLTSSPTSPFNPTITHHPRICVHAHAHNCSTNYPRTQLLNQHPQPTSSFPIFPRVNAHAYEWDSHPLPLLTNITTPTTTHAYAYMPTHMRGTLT
ncbi:hypothetical protein PIB30_105680 [Stylosanthes scabra]|uniref:Uncharacterized protein n=1 Tax=Stylosanthes scabra TaxID=79078 RepID=A0ABU6V1A9_9FABA|nr:hypothetical protein [Stylosanthes scabra]